MGEPLSAASRAQQPQWREGPPRAWARRVAAWLLAALGVLTLGAVALWYLDPHMMVELANRAWACF